MTLDQIVRDIRTVARHVLHAKRGYCGIEVDRAERVLRDVDMTALTQTINSVCFVSQYHGYQPLTRRERTVHQAARRLRGVLGYVAQHQAVIQAALEGAAS